MYTDFKRSQEVAIVSKWPAIESEWQEFVKAENTPPRGLAYAAFEIRDQLVLVWTLHIKSNYGGIRETAPKREESARQTVAHVKERVTYWSERGRNPLVIVCGDLNMNPSHEDWLAEDTYSTFLRAGLLWGWSGSTEAERVTWVSDGRYPDNCFDGFFSNRKGQSQTFEMNGASDHRGVVFLGPYR